MKTPFYLLLSLFLSTCAIAAPACCATNLPPAQPLPDRSIYNLESVWTSDFGKELKLDRFHGQPRILTMFFASCEYACPILVHDLTRIDAALKETGLTNASFILVTFDSERDTVERLHQYRRQRQLDDRWTLLRGAPDDVLELAAVLGINYKKEARGQFAHSNVILLLNARGEIVHRQIGLNQDPAPLAGQYRHEADEPRSPRKLESN